MQPAVYYRQHMVSVLSDRVFVLTGSLLHLISLLFGSVSAAWSEDNCPGGFKESNFYSVQGQWGTT